MQANSSDSKKARGAFASLPRIKVSARAATTTAEESAPDHAFGIRSIRDLAKAVSIKRHTKAGSASS